MSAEIKQYTKSEAIEASKEFLKEVNALEKKYGISFNSDEGDIYLSFKEEPHHWGTVSIGWIGDGGGLKVTEVIKNKDYYREQALNKLSDEERDALGL